MEGPKRLFSHTMASYVKLELNESDSVMSRDGFNPIGIITTDLHLSDKGEDQYRFDLFPWMIKKYNKKISAVFILGDLTDRKNYHADWFVNKVIDSIVDLTKCFQVFILKGNHDYDSDPDTPFWGFLDKIQNITYISKPKLIKWNGRKVLFLPHAREPGRDWKLDQRKDLDAILLHQTFKGAVSESGYELGGIGTTPFRKFTCPIFSGDVHAPQQVGPINYVGSPYHVHYGDQFTPRLLLVDNNFRTVDVHPPMPKKFVFDIRHAKDLRKYSKRIRTGDRAKVRLHLPTSEISSWPEQREEIRRLAEKMNLSVAVIILKELASDKSKRVQPTPQRRTHRETFHDYSKHHQVGEELTAAGETFLED